MDIELPTNLTVLESLEMDMGKLMKDFSIAINEISQGTTNSISLKKMAVSLVSECQKIDKSISKIDYLDLEED